MGWTIPKIIDYRISDLNYVIRKPTSSTNIKCFDAEGKPKYPTAEYGPSTQHLPFLNKENKCIQADLTKLQLTIEPCIEND